MGGAYGHSELSGALLTREVRWFADGPIPSHLKDWFASAARVETEVRIDRYDLAAAREGIGVKQRNMGLIDSKHRLTVTRAVKLAPRLVGNLEDWLKITETPAHPREILDRAHVEVAKNILARAYPLDDVADMSGCKVELALITIGQDKAWSLCFETFGHPNDRERALTQGVSRFLAETPLPEELSLNSADSCGYPEWIGQLAVEPA